MHLVAGRAAMAEPSAGLEEVVITADRHEANLQDTPSSITVFDRRLLQVTQSDDLRAIAAFTPGLEVGGYAALGTNPVTIRGIGQNPLGIGADDPVAIYLDGVYLGRAYSDVFDLVDAARIEVLKGPQGTLYGRNATGGAINIITRDPTNEVSAVAETRIGSLGEILERGLVGGPIVENRVFAQISLSDHHIDGGVTNRFDGSKSGGQNDMTARAKLILAPTDRLTLKLSLDANRLALNLDPKLLTEADQNLLSTDANYDGSEIRRNWGAAATADLDLDWARLTSITAFRGADFRDLIDQDGTAVNIINLQPLEERQHQFSEELRLATPASGAFNWLVGASFYRENATAFTYLPLQTGFGEADLTLQSRNETDSYAIFGNAAYSPLERLSLTAGIRYTYETKTFDFTQLAAGVPVFASVPRSTSTLSSDAVTPKFTASYRWSDAAMNYVSISRGFKSGGFSSYDYLPAGAASPSPFRPEDVWSYETGIKTDFDDHRVRIDLSVFHEDYSNLQVRIPDQFGFIVIKNAATATINGAEIESAFKPLANADIRINLSRLAAQYSRFVYAIGNATVDNSGKYLIRAPRWKGSILAAYRFEIPRLGSITPSADYTFEGHSFYDDTNTPINGHGWINIYDARLTFASPDGRWSAALYGLNLGNRLYVAYSAPVLNQPLGFPNQPRTFGVDVRYAF